METLLTYGLERFLFEIVGRIKKTPPQKMQRGLPYKTMKNLFLLFVFGLVSLEQFLLNIARHLSVLGEFHCVGCAARCE